MGYPPSPHVPLHGHGNQRHRPPNCEDWVGQQWALPLGETRSHYLVTGQASAEEAHNTAACKQHASQAFKQAVIQAGRRAAVESHQTNASIVISR